MDYKAFIKEAYKESKIDTPVGKITITKERSLYNALRQKYVEMGLKAADDFIEKYEAYTSCQEILDKSISDFYTSIDCVIEDMKDTLISKEEYDWDSKALLEYAIANDYITPFQKAYNTLENEIRKIDQTVQNERDYRDARKDSRGRWVGGTIGGSMIDAIGDQAEIAAMNLATGAVHSLVNMAGNAMSEKEAKKKKEALFKNPELFEMMMEGVFDSVITLKEMFIKIVINGEYTVGDVDDESFEKAQRLINNLKSGNIPAEKCDDICKQVFELNPYNDELYAFIYEKYGDDGRLSKIAKYFEVDELTKIKDAAATEFLKGILGSTEEDAIVAKDKLIEHCKENLLEVSDDLKCMKTVNGIIADFDLKYRTVADYECSTREAADFAREESEAIKKVLDEIKPLEGEPVLPYERYLLQQKDYITNTFKSELVEPSVAVIDEKLAAFNTEFCKTQLIGSADRAKAARDRALKYAHTLNFTTDAEYMAEYQRFAQFIEENYGVTIDEAIEARNYLEKRRAKIGKESPIDFGGLANDVTSGIKDLGSGLKGLFGKKK